MRLITVAGLTAALAASGLGAAEIYLDELDLSNVTSGESVHCPKVAPAVADVDFGAVSTNVIVRSGVGRLEGVLPAEVADNFTGWAKASVKTTALCEREGCFLRFETSPGASGGQFSVRVAEPLETGHYRMEVEARNCRRTRSRPLRFLARLGPPSWKALWSAEFGGRDWRRETSAFFIDAKDGRPELFLQTQPGTVVDIRRIRLTRITPQDYRAVHVPNAPSDDRRHFVRHTRFPLGLPSGWNTGRDGVFVETSAGRADDGLPTFRFVSARTTACFYSEPFLTSATGGVATVRIRYRAQGTWHASAFADVSYRWVGSVKLPASDVWREASFRITEPPDAEALSVKIAGCGSFELDRFDVTKGTADQPPDGDHVAEVTLQVSEGEVASSRLQFADEPAHLAWAVTDAPKGAELRLSVGDLYGRRRDLAPVALKGGRLETGTLAYLPETAAEVGQYRVDAEVFAGGVRVSPREELVVTRIRKPVYWKRTAPNSPFGTHLIARQDTLMAAKAAGVNWTRFHDAGTEYSGWYDLEREKGVWTFHDEEIERFRRAGILMYAQLGTAPLWATHFPETKFAKTPRNYFAKYLRPTNTVDYLAYVTKFVTRYRGVIDDYFIWNEPWGRWWVTADDARFFSTNRTELVRQYGRFSNATYAAAKAANPNARISGFNATGGQVDWWMEPLAEVGVMDACDDIDFHFYTPNARLCRADDEPLSEGPLAPLRKRWPDLKGKRVIMSEGQGVSTGSGGVTGRMTGLYRTIFAFGPESLESCASMADQTCRYNLDLLSEGVSRIFVYTTHSYETMAVKPKFQSFFGADGYPHPELVAHAHMARLIEDRAFVDKTAYGEHAVRLRFRGKDGTEVAAYTELSRQEAAELVRRHPDACTDLWGNPLDVAVWPEGTLVYRMRRGDCCLGVKEASCKFHAQMEP